MGIVPSSGLAEASPAAAAALRRAPGSPGSEHRAQRARGQRGQAASEAAANRAAKWLRMIHNGYELWLMMVNLVVNNLVKNQRSVNEC